MASTFVDSWRTPNLDSPDDNCLMDPMINAKMELECSAAMQQEGIRVCKQLISNQKFANCLQVKYFNFLAYSNYFFM